MGSYKGRNEIAIRLAHVIRCALTYRRPLSLPKLSKELGVCERTVWRDVAACRAARVPVTLEKMDRYGAEAL